MSICTFLAADHPLPRVAPEKEYPLHMDIDKGTIFDGDADDNFSLHPFPAVQDYTAKAYGARLEWAYYTAGRAERILAYIETILNHTATVEIWHVWLGDFYEYDERPQVHHYCASIGELTPEDIGEFCSKPIWTRPNQKRPSFYCLTISH